MITKSQLKEIKSLQLKKNRQEQQRFLVEGAKSLLELLKSEFKIDIVLGTKSFFNVNENHSVLNRENCHIVNDKQLEALGTFKNNSQALAVVKMKPHKDFELEGDELVLVLDDVRDPGNLGTIVRIADWYGIEKIIASETTTDFYNPKVINSSMGSFARVKVYYMDLITCLNCHDTQILGAFMDGESIHDTQLRSGGFLVMGNESNGISKEIQALITKKITIPKYGKAESLNVAIATAIICDKLLN